MTLTYYKDNSELFTSCVLWFTGRDQTSLGFPILPAGVTVTPNGSWTDLTSGVTRPVKNFDGSTNYISLTDNDAWDFNLNQDFTISFWAKYVTVPPYPTIACTCPGTAASAGWITYIGYEYRFSFASTTGTRSWNICNVSSIISWTSGQWYHFVIVRKNNVITLYRDMTQTAQATVANAITSSNPLRIGYDGVQASAFANNNIKDLLIYKGRALTQPEIIEIMRLTNPVSGRDFAAIYPGIRGVE